MLPEDKYFKTLTEAELWQRYCGFLDLSMDEFMAIQNELLMEQIERVADSVLGKKIMGDKKPKSVEEFRRTVPLTTYDDYEPYLSEQREDALPMKPQIWGHSAGRGGRFKWIPYTPEYLEKAVKATLSGLILATCKQKGRVNIAPNTRILFIRPQLPYASACLFQSITSRFSVQDIPSHKVAQEITDIQGRIRKGFQIALRDGVDIIGALASVLVRMGDEISGEARGLKLSASLLHPKVLRRLLPAWIRSKRNKRALLPKDLWPTEAIMTSGVDTAIYTEDIVHYWGREPYELYASTESFYLAIQDLNRKGMVFFPDLVFLEFIPYQEQLEHQDDPGYQPSTVLLSEIEAGKAYEVVISHFYGMPLLRYRMRDVIRVITTRDDETGVRLPQVAFQLRIGETINIGGLAELDEKTIWQAISNTGIKYADWIACKGIARNQAFIHLYLELKEKERTAEDIEGLIDEQLKIVDTDYKDIGDYLGIQPVEVTLLSPGTFQRYTEEKVQEGADLAHLKPSHINAPQKVVQQVLQLSESIKRQ